MDAKVYFEGKEVTGPWLSGPNYSCNRWIVSKGHITSTLYRVFTEMIRGEIKATHYVSGVYGTFPKVEWSGYYWLEDPESVTPESPSDSVAIETNNGFLGIDIDTNISLRKSSLDPKGDAGKLKPQLHLIPSVSMESSAKVYQLGAEKYGAWNWRENQVCATTYISAIMRHLNAWRDGEDLDPESRTSHLGHIIANCGILLDAEKHGKLVDDRAKSL